MAFPVAFTKNNNDINFSHIIYKYYHKIKDKNSTIYEVVKLQIKAIFYLWTESIKHQPNDALSVCPNQTN